MDTEKQTKLNTPIRGATIFSSEALGLKIKSVRLQKKLTQTALAKLANTRVATISQAEKGKARLDTVFKILFSLGLCMEIKPNENPTDEEFSLFLD